MARYRVFDTETAQLLAPTIMADDTVQHCDGGEYFTADAGEVVLVPSVRQGEVLYIRITNAGRPDAPSALTSTPRPLSEPLSAAQPASLINASGSEAAQAPEIRRPEPPRQYVATGFLGLDGELEEEIPEPPKSWWKRLID